MQDKVLIIEDTKSFALLLQKLLLDNYAVNADIAYNLAEARFCIHNNPNTYFASIVDLHLPDAPKGEAADLVVSNNIAALVFTATTDRKIKEDLWERGISDYAQKSSPHSLEYITWMINRIRKNQIVEVMVVDDSLVERKGMARLLKTQRLIVHTAKSAEQALRILDENPQIRVVILDCYLGDVDGFELATKMRDKYGRDDLEIIGVSSHSGQSISAQFIKSGANDFLTKPFIPEEFLCRVNHAVDRIENFTKLSELNDFKNHLLGTAAHDIRGPVGAIKTASDYMLSKELSPERKLALLKMIQSSSTSLIDLLDDLLDMSTLESGQLHLNIASANLSNIINERCDLYRSQAEEKDISLHLKLDDALLIDIDQVKIKQVIDNILTNAIKYSPIGGNVKIKLHKEHDIANFSVSDNGPGIPESELGDLFEPFKTLSSKATGGEKATGLGLAIVKNVVLAHQGSVDCLDVEGGGACFEIKLPLVNSH